MMAEPHYSQVPRTAIEHIAKWLAASNVGQYLHRNVIQPDVRLESLSYAALQPTPWGQVRERVLHIGQQPQLFGILSEPLTPAKGDLPIVVMINAGSSYRVGPNRLYVSLARQLAGEGFRSVRLDLCGLGDSVAPEVVRENDPYPATAFRDIDHTLKHIRTHLGAERVVVMGLCSGAYAAFQSAAQLDSANLVESVLINPLTFFWRDGMSLDASPALQLRTFQECMNSAWQPGKLLKLLSGRSKIGIGRALKILVQRWRLRSLPGAPSLDQACNAVQDGLPSHPQREDLPGDLDRVVKANRHLTCFFARSDPGYGILTFHAQRKVNELCRAGKLSLHFIDDADHTFSRHTARRALGLAIAKHLGGRYGRSCE